MCKRLMDETKSGSSSSSPSFFLFCYFRFSFFLIHFDLFASFYPYLYFAKDLHFYVLFSFFFFFSFFVLFASRQRHKIPSIILLKTKLELFSFSSSFPFWFSYILFKQSLETSHFLFVDQSNRIRNEESNWNTFTHTHLHMFGLLRFW